MVRGMNWRKSRRCGPSHACVETATAPGAVLVRDSKELAGPALRFGADAWRTFTASIGADHRHSSRTT
jgi:hypothetical protein